MLSKCSPFSKRSQRSSHSDNTRQKRLRLETLEDRRVLATLVVTDLGDDSLANLAGDGQLSLREAIEAVNTGAAVDGIPPVAGAFGTNDTILFSSALFLASPKTIALTAGQLELTSSVTIAGPLGGLLTIDAQENSRIFDITADTGDFAFNQLTLTNGLTTGLGEQGGAVRSMSTFQLSIFDSHIVDNATTGNFAQGGAIWSMGEVFIQNSTIENNRTEGTGAGGGGVLTFSGLVMSFSTIADNRTMGSFSSGGGFSASGGVNLTSSTVSGNEAQGAGSSAGGILALSDVILNDSTVSGNRVFDASASGAGLSSEGIVILIRSTIVNNEATGASSTGGGVRTTDTLIDIYNSIVANNSAANGADIDPGLGLVTAEYSLIGDTSGLTIPAATNILNEDPMLGPLSSNGGLTMTHAPLAGSPVIDQGDPEPLVVPLFDQRDTPFLRFVDGDGDGDAVMDIGSHELQIPSADFNRDGDVDGQDFLAWQRGFGLNNADSGNGDSDGDGDVDAQDLANWQNQYAEPSAPASSTVVAAATTDGLASVLAFAPNGLQTSVEHAAMIGGTPPVDVARDAAFATLRPTLRTSATEAETIVPSKERQRDSGIATSLDDELFGEQL